MESGIECINENIIEEELIQERKKVNKKLVIGLTVASLITITVLTTFLVGYFKFEWFQKRQDNVIQNTYHKGQVLIFNEVKTLTTEMKTVEGKKVVDHKFKTDFLVMINSKKKLNYFGEIDNMYNATLVILKMDTADQEVGGLNLLDEEKLEKIVKNPEQFEHPIAKFAFYENGTLVDIYLAKDTTRFYASSMVDLIEEIIPRISKSLYNKEQNGVEFVFDEEKEEIVEDHKDKEFTDKYSKIGFKGSKINKKITRKVSKDAINQVTIETQLDLNSDKPENDEGFYDIGLDGYTFKINSNLNICENKDDKELIGKIELIIEKLDYEESQKLLEQFAENEMGDLKKFVKETENSNEDEDEDKDEETDKKQLRNLAEKTLTTIDVLGKKVEFKLVTTFSKNKASFALKAVSGGATFLLSSESFTGTYKRGNKASFTLITVPFWVGPVPLKFTLKAVAGYEVKASFTLSTSQSKVELSGSIYGSLDGSIEFDIALISAGLGIDARLLTLTLSQTYNINSGQFSSSSSATIGPVTIYAGGHLLGAPWRQDICSSPKKTIYL